MGEIKAMEELREKIRLDVNNPWSDLQGDLLSLCDKVEREIAERYMELPLDADGTPIHVGDKMQYHGGEPFTVCAVAPGVIHTWVAVKLGERMTTYDYKPSQCTHYKPRTIEDVLREYALEMNLTYETGEIGGEERAEALDDLTAKYAKELRGMKVVSE